VITLAGGLGIAVEERELPREALYSADEVFLCGTAAEITPVRSVDRKRVGDGTPGPVTRALRDAFFGLFDGRTPDHHRWLTWIHAATRVAIPDHEQQQAAVHGRTPQDKPASMEISA
jgi:branched-chain amino acid aminotransferase